MAQAQHLAPRNERNLYVARNERLDWIDAYYYRWVTVTMTHFLVGFYIYTNIDSYAGICITLVAALKFFCVTVFNMREANNQQDDALLLHLRTIQCWLYRCFSLVLLGFFIWAIVRTIVRVT